MAITRVGSGVAEVVRVSVDELRRLLGIDDDELAEDLDVVDVDELEKRERERLG